MKLTNEPFFVDTGKLLLRIAIGGLMLFHGIAKIQHGVDFLAGPLQQHNLPSFIAYGVYIGEVLAPALVLIGLLTRLGAIVMAFNMAVAVWLMHTQDFRVLDQSGGWKLELPALYFCGALAIFFLGPGMFSVSGMFWGRKEVAEPPKEVPKTIVK
jgi:putative oxidoreductase